MVGYADDSAAFRGGGLEDLGLLGADGDGSFVLGSVDEPSAAADAFEEDGDLLVGLEVFEQEAELVEIDDGLSEDLDDEVTGLDAGAGGGGAGLDGLDDDAVGGEAESLGAFAADGADLQAEEVLHEGGAVGFWFFEEGEVGSAGAVVADDLEGEVAVGAAFEEAEAEVDVGADGFIVDLGDDFFG